MRNNTIILVKVLEISALEVNYKRFDFLDGPIYTQLKAKIKCINYANGYTEKFNKEDLIVIDTDSFGNYRLADLKIKTTNDGLFYLNKEIDEEDLYKILKRSNDNEVINLMLKSRRAGETRDVGFVAVPFGVLSLGSILWSMLEQQEKYLLYAAGFGCVGSVFLVIGDINGNKHTHYKEEAIKLYNMRY